LQLVLEIAGNTLKAICIGKDFLSRTPPDQQLWERRDKWDYMKLKSFCTGKELVSKLKRLEIPRWRLEGGSRKRASYSEILERHCRHTLQA
jgi:hypothetical protein